MLQRPTPSGQRPTADNNSRTESEVCGRTHTARRCSVNGHRFRPNPVARTSTRVIQYLTSDVAIREIVKADGDILLAAERLAIPKEELVAVIASDPSATGILNSQLRTLALLMTFESARMASVTLNTSIGELEPKDLASTSIKLIELISKLTDDKTTTQNINVTEHIMRTISPKYQQAVLELVRTAEQDQASPFIDHNPAPLPAAPDPNTIERRRQELISRNLHTEEVRAEFADD